MTAGAANGVISVRIQGEDFDAAAEAAAIVRGRTDVGAIVTFTGLCRDEAGTLEALELEHYPGMTEKALAEIVAQAKSRWTLQAVRVIHRIGRLVPGEQIVLVVVTASHRGAAFSAYVWPVHNTCRLSRPTCHR